MAIFLETFETDGDGSRYTPSVPFFTDGSRDYFMRTNGSNMRSTINYFSPEGNFYLAAMDTNGAPGNASNITVTWEDIDIAGWGNLSLEVLAAEDDADDRQEDWDTSSLVFFEYQIDGAGFTKVIQFASQGGNTEPGLDTNFDGVRDGAALTDTFASFANAIGETGSTLDLRLTINQLTANDEDIAIDAISLTGLYIAPIAEKFNPDYDPNYVAPAANLVVEFNKKIQKGTGNIYGLNY